MPNVVFLTPSSLQILDKAQTGVFSISQFLVKSLIHKNCHNFRTCNDIGVKLRPLTKLEKRNTKKIDADGMSANCDVIVIFSI